MAEWIEQQPKEAVKMIHALSDEFRVLSEISHCSLIPIKDEIRLCTAHLEIMSRRKGFTFELSTAGIDPNAMVPPAVIHTIVENAIVHNKPASNHVRLQLSAERENGFLCYTFSVPSKNSPTEQREIKEGTGFRYIKTRLEECYGQNWRFQSAREGDSWKTQIRVPVE